ncbi:MAG TPA: porin [Thermoanaerobaculia bacterium]|nr:porin [Thermoanaerobaculia bacterium]
MLTTTQDPRRLAARMALAALASTLLLAPAARAQDEWTTKWSNGFRVDSKDGQFKLQFGGRIQADYSFGSTDDTLPAIDDGFEFRRARLFMSGTVYERVEFKIEYDFGTGDAAAKDVYIALLPEWGKVRFGHYKESFSLEELTSSKYITFLERSLPIEAFAPSRNVGIDLTGDRGSTFNWGVGVFYDADDFGRSLDQDAWNVTGRLAFRPIYEDGGKRLLHLGIAASQQERDGVLRFRTRPEAHLSPRLVDTGGFAGDSTTLLGGELAGVFGPFWFASEYIQADTDAPAFGDPTFSGAYVQAGFFLTGESRVFKPGDGAFDRNKPKENLGKGGGAWEIALRYSTIDLTDGRIAGGEQDDVTLALNWYLNPVARLMLNLVRADVDGKGDADFVLLRWAIDF